MLNVDLVEDALPLRLLEPRHELRPQDVDLPVQQAPLVGDLVLLASQIGDELLEVDVGQGAEIGQRFQRAAFRGGGVVRSKAAASQRVNLNLRLLRRNQAGTPEPSVCMISSTIPRNSASSSFESSSVRPSA